MGKIKSSIRVTDLNGKSTDYESISTFCKKSGYSHVGVWNAIKRGHFGWHKYKNYKIEKI